MLVEIKLKEKLTATELQWLEQKFEDLTAHFNVATATRIDWQQQLFALYQHSNRHYHNLVHLYNLYQVYLPQQSNIEFPQLLEIAIWWHDAIYLPTQKDNEYQSALLAQSHWQTYLSKPQMEQVMHLINSTAKHQPTISQSDIFYFLDFDLSILATNKTTYQQYSQYIWQEYKVAYAKILYRIGRKRALRQFLKRPRLFFTDFFYKNYEKQAKGNIKLEIETL